MLETGSHEENLPDTSLSQQNSLLKLKFRHKPDLTYVNTSLLSSSAFKRPSQKYRRIRHVDIRCCLDISELIEIVYYAAFRCVPVVDTGRYKAVAGQILENRSNTHHRARRRRARR